MSNRSLCKPFLLRERLYYPLSPSIPEQGFLSFDVVGMRWRFESNHPNPNWVNQESKFVTMDGQRIFGIFSNQFSEGVMINNGDAVVMEYVTNSWIHLWSLPPMRTEDEFTRDFLYHIEIVEECIYVLEYIAQISRPYILHMFKLHNNVEENVEEPKGEIEEIGELGFSYVTSTCVIKY